MNTLVDTTCALCTYYYLGIKVIRRMLDKNKPVKKSPIKSACQLEEKIAHFAVPSLLGKW